MSTIIRIAVGAFALAAIVTSGSPAQAGAPARFTIRLLDVPTDRADDPRAHQYIIDHVAPGTVVERRIQVGNDSQQDLALDLYAGAASVEGGEFRFGEGRAENDLTSWASVDPPNVALRGGATAEATVRIQVPHDAFGGERYGVIWAEAVDGSGSVRTVNRVGVRVYLSVGGGPEPTTDFDIRSLTADRNGSGRPVVSASVVNTGGRALDLSGELQLVDGPGGLQAGPFPVEQGTTLAPGATGDLAILLDPELPDGPWEAVLTVSMGNVERTARASLTFPGDPGSGHPVVARPVEDRSSSGDPSGRSGGGSSTARNVAAAGIGVGAAGGLGWVLRVRMRAARGLRG